MSLRDIMCEDCGDVAARVHESHSAEALEGLRRECIACRLRGSLRTRDDGRDCGVSFFPDPSLTPTRLADMMHDLQRQVNEERAQQTETWWFIAGTGVSTNVPECATHMANWSKKTTNASHAKRLAGWPSGEWQWIKETA